MTAPARALTEEQARSYLQYAYAVRAFSVANGELMTNPADARRQAGVRRAITRLDQALTALAPPRQRRSPE